MAHFLRLLVLLVVLAGTLPSAPARASCIAPVAGLDWSIPADGAKDVPTNVTLWLGIRVMAGGFSAEPWAVTLDGLELSHSTSGDPSVAMQFKLAQPLAPHTHHVVHVAYPGVKDQPSYLPFDATIAFDTGAGPDVSVPVAPQISGFVENAQVKPATSTCELSVYAPYCFDTGGAMWRTLTTDAAPAAWIVRMSDGEFPVVSATSCTPKAWYASEGVSPPIGNGCWQVEAIDTTGRVSPATVICKPGSSFDAGSLSDDVSGTSSDTPAPSRSSGCTAGNTSSSGWLALAASLAALALRRFRTRKMWLVSVAVLAGCASAGTETSDAGDASVQDGTLSDVANFGCPAAKPAIGSACTNQDWCVYDMFCPVPGCCDYATVCSCSKSGWECGSQEPCSISHDAGPDVKDSGDISQDTGDAYAWTTCPAEQPAFGASGTACTGGLHCSYGTECCCGQCSASYVCDCTGGAFSCYYTDFCLSPNCSTGCTAGEFTTPSGCQSCSAIQTELPVALAAAVTPFDACGTASDCTTVDAFVGCGGSCPFALAGDQTPTGANALSQVAVGWCGGGFACGINCPEDGTPACVQGHCKLVGICDPQVAPTGSACDDGDACTSGDTCTGPGTCTGTTVNCDDGNACTAETCLKASGCHTAPIVGACTSGVACSLGGACNAGICVDSGATGWTVTLPKPESGLDGALTRLADGSYVIAHTVLNQAIVRVIHVDAAGQVLWDNANVAAGYASDVRGLADGSVLVAGNVPAGQWPDGKAALWHLDATGKLAQTTEIPVSFAGNVRLALRPEGGAVVTGSFQPALVNAWNAFVARVDAAGALLGKTDLGEVGNYGYQIFPAAHAGSIGILTSQATADGLTDARFVRLDAAGVVQVDVPVLPAPTNDSPTGILALPDGFLGAMATMDYQKSGDKLPGAIVFRLNDAGAVVWQKSLALMGAWLAPEGTGARLAGWTDGGSAQAVMHVQQVTADGVLTGDLTAPGSALGNGAIWLASVADGSALFATATGSGGPVKLVHVSAPGTVCVP